MMNTRFSKKQLVFGCALIAAVIIGLICSFVNFLAVHPSRTYSHSTVTLYFEEASAGMDPNGNKFYADSLLTDKVIENALASVNLSGEVSVSDVRRSLSLSGEYPKNLLRMITSYDSLIDTSISRTLTDSRYYPTKYSFVLGNEFTDSISKNELNALLDAIVDGYVDNFENSFSRTYGLDSINGIVASADHDYVYQIDIFRTQLELMRDNAKRLFDRRNSFTVSGKTFNDIAIRCDTLINKDLDRINSFVTLNVLSNDVTALTSYYEYRLRQLNLQKDELTKNLVTVTNYLADYKKDSTLYISSGDQVVKIDGNSSATYDSLVSRQIDVANELASVNADITDCTQKYEDIKANKAKADVKEVVENDISALLRDIEELSAEYGEMISAYNERYISTEAVASTGAEYSSGKILSVSFIAECVKCCGPFVSLVVLAAACVWLYDGIMESKRKNTAV